MIHLAALKAVGESCEIPLTYYKNNVGGSINLLEVCQSECFPELVPVKLNLTSPPPFISAGLDFFSRL